MTVGPYGPVLEDDPGRVAVVGHPVRLERDQRVDHDRAREQPVGSRRRSGDRRRRRGGSGRPRSRRATRSMTRTTANGSPDSAMVGGWIRGSGRPAGAGRAPWVPGSAVIEVVIAYPSGLVGIGRLAQRSGRGNTAGRLGPRPAPTAIQRLRSPRRGHPRRTSDLRCSGALVLAAGLALSAPLTVTVACASRPVRRGFQVGAGPPVRHPPDGRDQASADAPAIAGTRRSDPRSGPCIPRQPSTW